MKDLSGLAARYRVTDGRKFDLEKADAGDTWKFEKKKEAKGLLDDSVKELSDLQEKLYAQDRWALLLIFQAMDAAGKDSTIKHVMSGINPQGCDVRSFKAPSARELSHDFLWRAAIALPERGRIGIFNRSYYEEVLVVKVHPAILESQRLPVRLVTDRIWQERYEDINAFERHLAHSGVVIRKFFLNVSLREQKKRFLSRLNEPSKNWKFSAADLDERDRWAEYQAAYQEMIRQTSTEDAPWHVVPADHKWFMRLTVATIVTETLRSLDLAFPGLTAEQQKDLAVSRARLEADAS